MYHTGCIIQWLQNKQTCPLCRCTVHLDPHVKSALTQHYIQLIMPACMLEWSDSDHICYVCNMFYPFVMQEYLHISFVTLCEDVKTVFNTRCKSSFNINLTQDEISHLYFSLQRVLELNCTFNNISFDDVYSLFCK